MYRSNRCRRPAGLPRTTALVAAALVLALVTFGVTPGESRTALAQPPLDQAPANQGPADQDPADQDPADQGPADRTAGVQSVNDGAVGPTDDGCAPAGEGLDGAARPQDLAARYGVAPLHAAGHDGRGQTGAILQFGQSVDLARLAQWQRCTNTREVPATELLWEDGVARVVPEDALPPAGNEAQADAEVITGAAPGLDRLWILVAPEGAPFFPTLAAMLDAMADGSATGGTRPDVVSLSYGSCEAQITTDDTDVLEPALQRLSELGTWFFKGSGDSGSSDCAPKGACSVDPQVLSVHYPASSPWVTAVGGTEVRARQAAGERLVGPAQVWNTHTVDPAWCSGGGGGRSVLFPTPADQAGLPADLLAGRRGVPDVAALAGMPGYLTLLPPLPVPSSGTTAAPADDPAWRWVADGGDSLAGPLYAGFAASLRSALTARSVPVPTRLNPVLYRVAADPAAVRRVFADVTVGDNDLYELGAWSATPGYDLASGSGELRFDALLDVLAPLPTPPAVPAFTG